MADVRESTAHVASSAGAPIVVLAATAAALAAVGLTAAVNGHPATLAAAGLIAGVSLSGSV